MQTVIFGTQYIETNTAKRVQCPLLEHACSVEYCPTQSQRVREAAV